MHRILLVGLHVSRLNLPKYSQHQICCSGWLLGLHCMVATVRCSFLCLFVFCFLGGGGAEILFFK